MNGEESTRTAESSRPRGTLASWPVPHGLGRSLGGIEVDQRVAQVDLTDGNVELAVRQFREQGTRWPLRRV